VVEPNFAVDLDAARVDQFADLRPGLARKNDAQDGRDGFVCLIGGDVERLVVRDANGNAS
jgi:hypothetical protein